MPLEADYSIDGTARVYADGTRLLKARDGHGAKVAIKVLSPELSSGSAAIRRLRNEFEIGHRLHCAGALQALAFGTWKGSSALVTEDFDGQALDTLLGEPLSVERFLPLAERMALALASLHASGVVHRDVEPQNILVDTRSGEVKLVGLGIASLLPAERGSVKGATLIEGALAYMSPEQTGRMNRPVDHRSDLYSLGITFYEMLSGRLPFEAKAPLEWIHCHIARAPPPLGTVAPDVPPALAAIVTKLLSKPADERYQSARGLARDLRRCRDRLAEGRRDEPFALGTDDLPEHFQIPQRLYGREAEKAAMLSAFERAMASGAPELLLVAGGAGTGKSRLVHEMEEPIVRARGFFVSGKFDLLRAEIPYSTLVEAFREVVLEVLAGSDETIAVWRERLRAALGINAQLLVDVIPPLELVVGKQPRPPELPPAESQNRFRIVFRQCIGVFAQSEHPLTVFLDDLQWADMASLALLQDLLTRPERRHLFVVGAYRDNEVGPSHPLTLMLEAVRDSGTRCSTIVLAPLAQPHVVALVSDALRCAPPEAEPLARLVHQKTDGNPFFAVQFLGALHDEGLIALDREGGSWRWDLAKIRAKSFTDNVVQLMVEKLERLPAASLEAMRSLACVGSGSDIATLALVHGRTEQETHADLRDAVANGLLVLTGDTYRFLHDRIQEATYSLVPEADRPHAHLRIGRLLVRELPAEAVEARVFDVVNQLNRGTELITDPAERASLSRLNVLAGRKAKAAVAYAAARGHLARAVELLPPDAWERRHEETFRLFLERSECEFLAGEFERADELFGLLLEKARSNPERVEAWILRMRLYQFVGRFADAVTVMLEALRQTDVRIPEDDDAALAALADERREVTRNLRGRAIADIADAPRVTDPDVRAIISLLVAGIPCAQLGRPRLFPLVIMRALNLALRHGNTEDACFAYSAYGTVLVGIFDDIAAAVEFTEMSIRLNAKLGDARLKATILYLHAQFVHCWRRPFATVLPVLDRLFSAFLEVGELVFASYHAVLTPWATLESGEPLDEVLRVSRRYADFASSAHSEAIHEVIRVEQQLVACLKGRTRGLTSFEDDAYVEKEIQAALFLHVAKQMACVTFGRHAEALEHATRAASGLDVAMATPIVATHHFLLGITLAALHAQAGPEQQAAHELRLEELLAKLARWAESCPENYQGRHALLAAEMARLGGRELEAMRLYEEAIRSSRAHGLVHNEALAFELAAAFYRSRGFDAFAETYLREARDGYARWGADGKVNALDGLAPGASGTFTASSQQLDLFAVVEALQTISGAIVLDELVSKLLRIVLEQSGAQKVMLFVVEEGGRLSLEAAAEATRDEPSIARTNGAPSPGTVPQAIVEYTWRTKERVLLDDASNRSRFSSDAYVARVRPRSVLCLPITSRSEIVGLLYLENNLVTRAFTPDRLSVLELLAAQAAISLENARLYGHLERENAERLRTTEALRQSEERFRLLVDGVKDCAVFMVDARGCIVSWNAGAQRLFGYGEEEILGRSGATFFGPEEIARGGPERAMSVAGARGASVHDGWRVRKDGSRFFADVVLTALRDESGELRSYSVLVRDLTQRLKLEEQVRESQKMEAVGRLAGGVAHDFNNLLGAIYGFVYHGLRGLPQAHPVRSDLEEIQDAARRAGELTKQLLSFARKQRVEPRVFDLNDLVLSMDRLLRRVLGDDVELVTHAAPGLGSVEADPGQIEQVILNLAVNARDAMPNGGALTIETSSVELGEEYSASHAGVSPGRYTMLALSDSGTGMEPEVLEHIFEPFFTTKAPGEGTGLGLATSYGIVKQAGGHIWVYSEPGHGTTFKLYLPRSSKGGTSPLLPRGASPPSRGETLLLVEDHAMLRAVATRGLEALGYRVLAASGGDEALELASAFPGEIPLLVTDVVMPRMSGHELATRLTAVRPALKVIFVSGYTESSLVRSGEPRPGQTFLAKPFTPDELARRVREVLDGVVR